MSDAPRVLAPLRKLGKAVKDDLAPATYLKLQGSTYTPGVSKFGVYVRGGLIFGLTPGLIDALCGLVEAAPSNLLDVWMQAQGGAIGRVAPTATAYWGRGASHNMGLAGAWQVGSPDAERNTEWVRHWSTGRAAHAWQLREHRQHRRPRGAWRRRTATTLGLTSLKKRYDPANLSD